MDKISFRGFPLVCEFVQNVLQERLHIFRNVALFKSSGRKSDIKLLLDFQHPHKPVSIDFLALRLVSLNHSIDKFFGINASLNWSSDNGKTSLFEHRNHNHSLSNIEQIKPSLNLISVVN